MACEIRSDLSNCLSPLVVVVVVVLELGLGDDDDFLPLLSFLTAVLVDFLVLFLEVSFFFFVVGPFLVRLFGRSGNG